MNEYAEYCPYCGNETEFNFEQAITHKGRIICKHCRKKLLACSICSHRHSGEHCGRNCFEYKEEDNA